MIMLCVAYAVFIAGFVLCDLLAGDLPAILYAIAFYPVFLILYGGVKNDFRYKNKERP